MQQVKMEGSLITEKMSKGGAQMSFKEGSWMMWRKWSLRALLAQHCEKRYDGSSKNSTYNYPMIQDFHFCVCTPKN